MLVALILVALCHLAISNAYRFPRNTLNTGLNEGDRALLQRIIDATGKPLKEQAPVVQEICLSVNELERRHSTQDTSNLVGVSNPNNADPVAQLHNLYKNYQNTQTLSDGFKTLREICKLVHEHGLLDRARSKRSTDTKCLLVAGGSMGLLSGTIAGAGLGSAAGPGGVLIGAAAGFATGFVSGFFTGLATLGQLCIVRN